MLQPNVLEVEPGELWIDSAAALVDDPIKFKEYFKKLEEKKKKEEDEKRKQTRWKDKARLFQLGKSKKLPSIIYNKITSDVPYNSDMFLELESSSRSVTPIDEYEFPAQPSHLKLVRRNTDLTPIRGYKSLPSSPMQKNRPLFRTPTTPISIRSNSSMGIRTFSPPTDSSDSNFRPLTRANSVSLRTASPTSPKKKPFERSRSVAYPMISEPIPRASLVIGHLQTRRDSKILLEQKLQFL
jgi:hypothetical protein